MRHRGMVAPITSIKHYVHQTNLTIASGAINNHNVVNAVIAPATTLAGDVVQGAIVKAIYIERWIVGDQAAAASGTFLLAIDKVPAGATAMTFAQSANLGGYPNKKNILYTTQGIVSDIRDGSNPVPIIRGWIKIPKGKQRMGLGDRIVVNFSAINAIRICGVSTYKEYT